MSKKLYRDEQRQSLGGVCAGLADYFDIDVSIIRGLFLLALIFAGSGVLLYIILWIVLPKKDFTFPPQPGVDYTTMPGDMPDTAAYPASGYKRKTNTGLVGGVLLITAGGFLLLDEFNLIPNFDFGRLWPVVLVILGASLIFTSAKSKTAANNSSNTDTPIV